MGDDLTFTQIIEGVAAPMATTTADGRVDSANKQFLDYLDVSLEELKDWEMSGVIHPDDLPRVVAAWRQSLDCGEPYELEQRIRRADGVYQWVQVRSLPLRDTQGHIRRWCVLFTDIAERKSFAALLDGEKRLLEMVASGCPLEDVLDATCRLVDTVVGNSACSILLVDPNDTFRHGAGPALPRGYDATVNGAPVVCEAGPCGTAASSKQQVIVPDLASDPRWVGHRWRTLVLEHDLRSVCSTPVVSLTGKVLGTFAIYRRDPGPPTALVTELISRFTHIASIAIERAISERERQERERDSRMIVDSIPGMVALLTPSGDVEVVNPQLIKYFGQTVEQLRQWRMADTIHPEDLPHVIETFTRSITSGSPYEIVQRFRRSDGVYRWFLNCGLPIHDSSGQIARWCVLLTDIDERKRAEDALRDSERESRLIVDRIPGIVGTYTPSGEIEILNQRMLEYFGRPLEEMRHWEQSDIFHPEDLQRAIQLFAHALASQEPLEYEARLRRFDGVYRWFQVRAVPARDTTGRVSRWYTLVTDIDDRKHAEDALRGSERSLKLTVDTIPALVWAARPDGSAEFFNQHYLDFTGLSEAQASGWGWTIAVHPEDLEQVAATWQQIVASEAPGEAEARLRRHDGAYRWFLFRANPLRDERGNIATWYGINTDIEDLKTAEDALRKSERQFRLLVETIPALVWCGTPEGQLDYLNQRAVEYLGHTAQSLAGGGWLELVHPDQRDATVRRWLHSATTDSSYDDVYQLRRADGQYRWVQSVGAPFHDTDGRIAYWYGQIVDIDDRKRAETELRQAYDSFADAQHLSHTGSFITDLVGDDHNWSEETYRIFEFEPGSKVTLQRIAAIIHPDDRPSFESMIAQAMSGDNVDFSFRIVTTQAAVKYVRGVAHLVEKIEGRPMFVGALQDVTESKVAEEALNKSRSELAHVARVTAVSALTASIAHEVNQPLSGIITNAGTCLRMLAADPPDVDGARETAKRTLRDGNRAADVITRLRALFSKREFTLEPLDINEVAREVVALSLSDLQRNRMVLQSEFAPGLPPVIGDRIQLQQVILNLLRNASDAMVSVHDRPRQLVIRTERDADNRVRLTVRDAGVGLDAQRMNKLFDAFYTTKTDGMGVGLSVSRSIIERHHGDLWAEPNDGPGATFSFAIPAAPEIVAGAIDTKV